MQLIDLPRALEEYFAYAETEATRKGRRFSITLPFYAGDRLDRLQWWYHVSPAEELMYDGDGIAVFRARATERFRRHIERWLANTQQCLFGEDAIPRIAPIAAAQRAIEPEVATAPVVSERVTPAAKVVNG
jgi:hypothetical protein